MKNVVSIILVCLLIPAVFIGCGTQTVEQDQGSQMVAMGNPWSDWDSMEEAEEAVGFSFELPEVIGDRYTAVAFRTMNNELIEIIYRDAEHEIRVRKQKGEGLDISGDYTQYDICTEENINGAAITHYHTSDSTAVKQLISYGGYSWSIVAYDGYQGDSDLALVRQILEQ